MSNKYKVALIYTILLISMQSKTDYDLTKFKEAYLDIDFFIKNNLIKAHLKWRYDTYGNRDYYYSQTFNHLLAKQSYEHYCDRFIALNYKLILNTSSNGFILGIIAACCNKIVGDKKINLKSTVSLL